MSDAGTDLMALATSVVDQAKQGEGLEVYVARGTDTEVRAYEGEVESLTSADSSGVGIRVLLDADGAGAGARRRQPGRLCLGGLARSRRHRRHPGRCPGQRPLCDP